MKSPGRTLRDAIAKFLGPRDEPEPIRFEDMNRAQRRSVGYHVRRYADQPLRRTSRIDRRIGGRLTRHNADRAYVQHTAAKVKDR